MGNKTHDAWEGHNGKRSAGRSAFSHFDSRSILGQGPWVFFPSVLYAQRTYSLLLSCTAASVEMVGRRAVSAQQIGRRQISSTWGHHGWERFRASRHARHEAKSLDFRLCHRPLVTVCATKSDRHVSDVKVDVLTLLLFSPGQLK